VIVKTEAVILHGMKYRESSKILRMYTRQFGKISVIAKGARQPRSRFGSALEPMSHVSAVFYKKDQRELHLLTQCDLVSSYRSIANSVERLAPAMAIVELVDSAAHPDEPNEGLFSALVDSLRAIDDATTNHSHILYSFELKLSDVLGFRPNLSTCAGCGNPLRVETVAATGAELHLSAGGVLCAQCSRHGIGRETVSWNALSCLQRLHDVGNAAEAANVEMSATQRREVHHLLQRYLQRHVAGFDRLKSETVFQAMA
jgi:DNA repair protein RecO (recombination protein O)